MRIGLFTDCHAASIPAAAGKYFSHSYVKFQDYGAYFHREKTDFAVCLGDVCEWTGSDEDVKASMMRMVFPRFSARCPFVYVIGNHDAGAYTKADFLALMHDPMSRPGSPSYRRMEMPKIDVTPADSPYYSFVREGWKFIALDTNYRADGSSIEKELIRGTTYINAPQLDWLRAELTDGLPTVVFTHANLDSRMVEGELHPCVLGNCEEVRKVLEGGNVKLVLQGHAHEGGFTETNGIPYVTLRATVLGQYPDSMSVGVLDITDGKLRLEGYGMLPSYEF